MSTMSSGKAIARLLNGGGPLADIVSSAWKVGAIQIAGLGALFASQILLARWLGEHDFGVYTFAFAVANFAAVVAALGIPSAAIRLAAQLRACTDWDRLCGVIAWSRKTSLLSGLIAAILACVILAGLAVLGTDGFAWSAALLLAQAAIPILALMKVQSGLARGLGAAGTAYWPDSLGRPLAIILLTGGIVLIAPGTDFLLTAAVGVQVAALAGLAVLQHRSIVRPIPELREIRTPRTEPAAWMAIAKPLLAVTLMDQVITRADVMLIGVFLAPGEVAVYHAASRLSYLLQFVVVAFNSLAAGRIATLHAQGDLSALQTFTRRLVLLIAGPTTLMLLVIVLLDRHLLAAFGDSFVRATPVLLILSVGQWVSALLSPSMLLMTMTGHQRRTATVFAWCAAANVILNLTLIPAFGIYGAATATALTFAGWQVWLAFRVRKDVGVTVWRLT